MNCNQPIRNQNQKCIELGTYSKHYVAALSRCSKTSFILDGWKLTPFIFVFEMKEMHLLNELGAFSSEDDAFLNKMNQKPVLNKSWKLVFKPLKNN